MSRIGRSTYQPEVGQLSTFDHYADVVLLTDACARDRLVPGCRQTRPGTAGFFAP
jgi:hypothetical protein